jgi:IclR family transcriptional regulator, pca regulon regulatory protein
MSTPRPRARSRRPEPGRGVQPAAGPRGQLEAVLEEVAAQGYAYAANEVEAGFHSIAVPLRRWDETTIAALNVGSTIEPISHDDMIGRVLPVLRTSASKLQPQLV